MNEFGRKFVSLFAILIFLPALARADVVVQDRVACAVPDRQQALSPDATHLDGFLGSRIDSNAFNRLLKVDENQLLKAFRHRPGAQEWDGEHVGKWLHASTLAWVYTGDARLKAKLDRVASELGKCQLDDGYLGTYLPEQRWTAWDVWAHKYDMIGLLTYYRFTGDEKALEVSRRCGDLLCASFGNSPGQRNLLDAGYHCGMAPSSVLEPMVLLYRLTGEPRYRAFCDYIVAQWETPKGPKIISTLLSGQGVDKVGNGKAYEMLSCLNGMLELYRTEGDEKMLRAAVAAWKDIVEKRLYITGTASYKERFSDDFDLPNGDSDVGETCVTVTWIQFNAQLLRLTGEARYAEQLERSVYNQLLGAQRPDGCAWGYYVQMEGKKPYSDALSGNCCLSSGPRGVALIPTFSVTTDADGVVVNFLGPSRSKLTLPNGQFITVTVQSTYPDDGRVRIQLSQSNAQPVSLKVRIPEWCGNPAFELNGAATKSPASAGGYAIFRRSWSDGDVVGMTMPMPRRVIEGTHGNRGKVAFARGPLVLAADDSLNPDAHIGSFRIAATGSSRITGDTVPVVMESSAQPTRVHLVPFAEAGSSSARYQVWLPGPNR